MLSHSEPVVPLLAEWGGRRGSSQTGWGRLQWIAPASANKVQRLGPRPEKTTFGTLYQVLMTGLKLWLIYPLILSVILAMIANFFHQMHLCLYFVFCALHSLFTVHKHHHPSIQHSRCHPELSSFYNRRKGCLFLLSSMRCLHEEVY